MAPVSTVAVSLVPVMAGTPPVSTLVAGPGAASDVSTVTVPAAPLAAVAPPTAAAAPVPAGACAPAVAPPTTTRAPPPLAGAPPPPAVAVRALPPSSAVGAPLSVGVVAVPRLLPTVPTPHHLFLPSLPVLLRVLLHSPLLRCSFFAQPL